MSIINENIGIKIREVCLMSWDVASVSVAARPYHALAFRICGGAFFSHENLMSSTNAGDVFYMPANYSYDAIYQGKNEILVVHFESDFISEMENYKLNNSHMISMLFNRLYEIWNKKEEGYYYSALAVLCNILENISVQQSNSWSNETIKAFEDVVEYIEENYTSNEISVKEMVEKAHMSNTYFRKLFFNKFKMTPSKYLTYKRLTYSEKLLSTGKYSIRQVAEMSGFGDVKYFSRVVKKEYGVPPSKLYCHIIKN